MKRYNYFDAHTRTREHNPPFGRPAACQFETLLTYVENVLETDARPDEKNPGLRLFFRYTCYKITSHMPTFPIDVLLRERKRWARETNALTIFNYI